MPSPFAHAAARANVSQLQTFGEPAQYRAGGTGVPVELRAIDTPDAQAVGESGFIELRHEIHIGTDQIAAPARGDTVTFTATGMTHIVQQHEPADGLWRLIVRRGGI